MLEKKTLLVEIFKRERGSLNTSGNVVCPLPLFSIIPVWEHSSILENEFVLDILDIPFSLISEFPMDLVELCNKKWEECILNNLDNLCFEYEYQYRSLIDDLW